VLIWRRSYDVPPPGGESLKDTAARTLPYYEDVILPFVKEGETVLVAAHGNSLRSMVMAIEKLTPDEILKRELATGEPVVYRITKGGKLKEKVEI
jgi:2,3-bisphosphoglycerate-dependent phosphoglycerate mutase